MSSLAQAAREAFGNTHPGMFTSDAWSLNNPTLYTLIWMVIILVSFVPLSVRQYKRAASRQSCWALVPSWLPASGAWSGRTLDKTRSAARSLAPFRSVGPRESRRRHEDQAD